MSYYGPVERRQIVTGMSLDEAIHAYLIAFERAGASVGSCRAYRYILRTVSARLPRRQFSSITTQDLSRVLYGPDGITLGKSSRRANTQRAAINGLFGYGYSMGWRRDLLGAPRPVMRVTSPARPLTTRLTADQLAALLTHAEYPMTRALVATAMNTALRISDVLKIQLGDLDLATGDLAVVTQKTRLTDVLPVTLDLDAELRRYLVWLTAETGVTVRDREMRFRELYLFPGFRHGGFTRTHVPERPVSYRWANAQLAGLYAACGIEVEPREAWHVIRRSVARIYFDSLRTDVSFDHALRQTSALLGHRLAATTELYLGLNAERQARDESLRGKRLIVPSQNVSVLRKVG